MKTTRSLSIDIETYSSVDLKSCGAYKYCEADDFQILLFAYAFDEDPVEVIDLTESELPRHLIDALTDPSIIKRAYNAQFERTCLSKYLKVTLNPRQWRCTQVLASAAGLPGNLGEVARVLMLDQQKMDAGKSLIPYFCKPCAPTKSNHQRTRNLPHHDPAKWDLFKRYNAQDVETERDVLRHVDYTFTETERSVYILDQEINDRGVEIDLQLVEAILQYNDAYSETLYSRAKMLSGLENPNSRKQLLAWLKEQGIDADNTQKATVKDLLEGDLDADITEMLKLRQEMAKSSLSKYNIMDRTTCADGRIRGTLQYYGANRTGRWAGRLVQVQNLPKTFLKELGALRDLVKRGDFETLEVTYDAIVDLFSQLIRTAFIPKEGCQFAVCDFSAIEARVVAWLANEKWRLEVFATHGKIYEAAASNMFKIPIEEITKTLRSKGKVSELSCAYGGSSGALIRMGALDMGLQEEELPGLVKAWRNASPSITRLWKNVEACVKRVIDIPDARINLKSLHKDCPVDVFFSMNGKTMEIELPSGRKLCYYNASVRGDGPYARIVYDGPDQKTKKWLKAESYGAKMVENIIQAIARDCLAESMLRIDALGLPIAFHVHDEVIVEVPSEEAEGTLKNMQRVMAEPIDWAPGLKLSAAGFCCDFYLKD